MIVTFELPEAPVTPEATATLAFPVMSAAMLSLEQAPSIVPTATARTGTLERPAHDTVSHVDFLGALGCRKDRTQNLGGSDEVQNRIATAPEPGMVGAVPGVGSTVVFPPRTFPVRLRAPYSRSSQSASSSSVAVEPVPPRARSQALIWSATRCTPPPIRSTMATNLSP